MGYRIAVVGATGNVGREMLNILAEREFPVDEIVALASRRSLGTECSFGEKTLRTLDLDTFDFTGWDMALFAIGSDATKKYAPIAANAGCVVIDNSSLYRYDADVPLIVPEVNPDAVMGYGKKNIIANPNCSTAQMVVALKPLHDRATIRRVVVSTYQSVSGSGKEAMDELWLQTKGIFVPGQEVEPKIYPKQIAFNVIPHIDVFLDSGETKEEWKMVAETKKIMDPKIKVTATCVRVPVFVGHSEAINIEFADPLDAEEAREILRESPGRAGDRQARARWLHDAGRMRGRICDLCEPHPRRQHDRERAEHLGGLGQPPQGGGAERGPDRGTARSAGAEEGLIFRPSGAAGGQDRDCPS